VGIEGDRPAAGCRESTAGPTPDRVAFIDALRKVPAEQRRALVLYHLCDLTVDQVAAETGVRAGTVKARLARGRAALAPYLREAQPPRIRLTWSRPPAPS
jgi:RNA polymerase sigma-70 factor (ECF subfamily)